MSKFKKLFGIAGIFLAFAASASAERIGLVISTQNNLYTKQPILCNFKRGSRG